jgi:hypothetical protein
VWLPEDGSRPLNHAAVDRYHVDILVCASCWSCEMKNISLHGMNNFKIITKLTVIKY